MTAPAIALLTDFGDRDWYVASMKAVLLQHAPNVPQIDITHQITPGAIDSASFILSQCWLDFPEGTVFVAVVDPGVGSQRRALALQAEGRFFVGPDNGLFKCLSGQIDAAHEANNPWFFRDLVTHTFHGRDIFAPVAAHLASGVALAKVGPALNPSQLTGFGSNESATEPSEPKHTAVQHIDRFGNVITDFHRGDRAPQLDCAKYNGVHFPFGRTFADAATGQPVSYYGSGGFLELAVNRGNAAEQYRISIGDPVIVVGGSSSQ